MATDNTRVVRGTAGDGYDRPMGRLSVMNRFQRTLFAKKLFGHLGLPGGIGTTLLMKHVIENSRV